MSVGDTVGSPDKSVATDIDMLTPGRQSIWNIRRHGIMLPVFSDSARRYSEDSEWPN